MEDKEILEIHNLDDDDLLSIYQMLVDHIQYLNSSIVEATVEEEGETTNE